MSDMNKDVESWPWDTEPEIKSSEHDDDELKPLVFDDLEEQDYDDDETLVPISSTKNTDGIKIKDKESNFVFFFGTAESGKSVILSSMLYYLSSQAGVLRPKLGTPNTKEAQVLLSDFFENIRYGILPNRTTRDRVTRLDFVFEPNNRSSKVPPVNFTFLETSGENHNEIRRGGVYHDSIEVFLRANIPLTFIIVTSYESADRDDTLINEFLDGLEKRGKHLKTTNVILVVSKWDKSGRAGVENEEELEDFIREHLSRTSQRIDTYGLSKTYYTIGTIEEKKGRERITNLNLDTAEVLSRWLYKSIVGYEFDYEGTFWERIKFSFM